MFIVVLQRSDDSGATLSCTDADRVGLDQEMSNISSVSSGSEGDHIVFKHLFTTGPVNKVITFIGRSGQSDFIAFKNVASTRDGTTFSGLSHSGDGVHRDDGLGEVGNQSHVTFNGEGIDSRVGHFLSVHGPVEEVETIVSRSRNGDLITKVIRTIGDDSGTAFTSLNSDVIVNLLKMSNIFGITGDCDLIFSFGADHLFTQRPIDE